MIKDIKIVITIMETRTKCFSKVTEAHRMASFVLMQSQKDDEGTELRFRQFGFASWLSHNLPVQPTQGT